MQLKAIGKEYPGVVALNNVNVSFREGEVHALLGENGAGKSTLIKILAGAIEPNVGEIVIEGITYKKMTPLLAQQLGIGVIYQEFNLVPSLTIYENIFLGNEIKTGIIVNKRKMIEESKKLLLSLEIDIDPTIKVKKLSVAYQQIVEIAKAVSKNVKVLIMDEPTAPLTDKEVNAMFKVVKKLVEQKVTIIYISHRLEELFEISDRVTILRDGKYIDTKITKETNKQELVNLMVGRELTEQFPKRDVEIGEVVLDVRNVYAGDFLQNVSLQIKAGEIVGLAGLVGSGRTELARVIFGADKMQKGEVYLNSRKLSCKSPVTSIADGIALIPEDRKKQGALLKMSVADNVSFAKLKRISKFSIVNRKKEVEITQNYINKMNIKTPNQQQLVKNLSGGNQQKVVLAKWLAIKPKLYIFDEPTRGIDVGAKYEIYDIMNKMVARGDSILMISSELPEILGLSDRIVVMSKGKVSGELSKEEANQNSIMHLASLGKKESANE